MLETARANAVAGGMDATSSASRDIAAAAVKAVPAIPGHSLERKESNDTAKTEEITDEVDIVENDCFSIMSSCTNCDRVNLSDFVEYAREVGGMRADDSIIRRQ